MLFSSRISIFLTKKFSVTFSYDYWIFFHFYDLHFHSCHWCYSLFCMLINVEFQTFLVMVKQNINCNTNNLTIMRRFNKLLLFYLYLASLDKFIILGQNKTKLQKSQQCFIIFVTVFKNRVNTNINISTIHITKRM